MVLGPLPPPSRRLREKLPSRRTRGMAIGKHCAMMPDGILIGTANVLTLRPKQMQDYSVASLGLPAKVAILEAAFEEKGFDVVCIQEGRRPSASEFRGEHFVMHSSGAAPSGNYGVEIWISLRISKYIYGTAVFSNRCMAVHLCLPTCRCIVISAHAPHEAAKDADKATFW